MKGARRVAHLLHVVDLGSVRADLGGLCPRKQQQRVDVEVDAAVGQPRVDVEADRRVVEAHQAEEVQPGR